MAKHIKPVARALELLGETDGEEKERLHVGEEEFEDCVAWVVAKIEPTIDGLAEAGRLDAESVALLLAEVHDMLLEALSELRLAAHAMNRDKLEREKWLDQRIVELESGLDARSSADCQVAVDKD